MLEVLFSIKKSSFSEGYFYDSLPYQRMVNVNKIHLIYRFKPLRPKQRMFHHTTFNYLDWLERR